MIINPIMPIWFVLIVSIFLMVNVIYNKELFQKIEKKYDNKRTVRQNELLKNYVINSCIKVFIIILIFIINLRIMVPNGIAEDKNDIVTNDLSVLFVIDTSVSMKALDYNGNNERLSGVMEDCEYIVNELSGSKFSIITFGDSARKLVPFTNDSDMIIAELKSINVENDYYAKGTSINLVKDTLEQTLKDEILNSDGTSKIVVFFISDGEITVDGEKLNSFDELKKYVFDGAVMGYGTESGGKMIDDLFKDVLDTDGSPYYITYYDENDYLVTGISKIDEKNLKSIANDLGIDYIKMNSTDNIKGKLESIRSGSTNSISRSSVLDGNIKRNFKDIYYYFAIPLAILFVVEFYIQKKKIF